jgi:hypothetical protein
MRNTFLRPVVAKLTLALSLFVLVGTSPAQARWQRYRGVYTYPTVSGYTPNYYNYPQYNYGSYYGSYPYSSYGSYYGSYPYSSYGSYYGNYPYYGGYRGYGYNNFGIGAYRSFGLGMGYGLGAYPYYGYYGGYGGMTGLGGLPGYYGWWW